MDKEPTLQIPEEITLETRSRRMMRDLVAQPEYATMPLSPEEVFELPNSSYSGAAMVGITNNKEGVEQHLLAVVDAGKELFGIVNFQLKEKTNPESRLYTLTDRLGVTVLDMKQGGRASLVDFVEPGKQLIVGRDYQPHLNDHTSRKHFGVAIAIDGTIGIADLNSTNGTRVVFPKAKEVKTATAGSISGPSQVHNPVEDFELWSVKSSELRSAIRSG